MKVIPQVRHHLIRSRSSLHLQLEDAGVGKVAGRQLDEQDGDDCDAAASKPRRPRRCVARQCVEIARSPDKAGEQKLVWKREPVESVSDPIMLREGRLNVWHPDPGNDDVFVTGLCRARDGAWTVTLFLVNGQQEPTLNKDEAWLFQPELEVRAPDGAPVFLKRVLPSALNQVEPEDRAMQMLYRRTVEFAVGHSVAVHVEPAPDSWERAVGIRTTIVPTYEVERMDPPTPELIPQLGEVELDMKRLSELSPGEYKAALQPLVDTYSQWIDTQNSRIGHEADLETYADSARTSIKNCREARDRIQAGIDLLDANPQAAKAFAFANKAMYQQRIHSIYSGRVQNDAPQALHAPDQRHNPNWRAYQLASLHPK